MPESPPLNVRLVANWFYPILTGGGHQFRQYGPGLDQRGVRLRVATLRTPETEKAADSVDRVGIDRFHVAENVPGMNPHRISARLLENCLTPDQWTVFPSRVVQLFSASRHHLGALRQARRLGAAPVLCYTMYPEPRSGPWWRRWKAALTEPLLYRSFRIVTVYTSVMADELHRRGVSRDQLRVVPFGVDTDRFSPATSGAEKVELRRRLGLPDQGPLVLFAGSVIERKGADLLMEAWGRLQASFPDAHLVFVGPHQLRSTFIETPLRQRHETFAARLEALRQALPNPDRVHFVGEVAETSPYFRAADVFAFPSRQEGFGAVIGEAMACGLPCVLSPFLGFPKVEFGLADHHFLLADHNPSALSDRLESLLSDLPKAAAMGERARAWAVDRLGLDHVVGLTHQAYLDAASQSGRKGR